MSTWARTAAHSQKKKFSSQMKDIKFNCAFYNVSAFVIATCVKSTAPPPRATLPNIQSAALIRFKAKPIVRYWF